MTELTGNVLRIGIADYFVNDLVVEEVSEFVRETRDYITIAVLYDDGGAVIDFVFESDASYVAVLTKLRFGQHLVEVFWTSNA